ncbi:hypothetical protein SERLA73DRAFT_188573 [Serpula lacrymans var. lacrymans S7.3]|uniref:Uncharacterized protein n=2 Tax=Serpula lacrymans var. lacrymans TaxID=341189 RepID=F8QBL5_SERL3|nr:uncharacterized protein SERLADRAFT_478734 [Serpula lacrymans var. lacrymans S7.9]EGN94601.1 hypothetical protein SERLA73DRAFT_188573 [Serpula lacrymans var. lacrymans S7.3]EGO20078.1 hypothetical protein SERLADRAFT_478734 [Serpula lacrymans var. lacrymans S7.9]
MTISGAVFTDRFISQRLTENIYLGGGPRLNNQVYNVARALRLLKEGIADLHAYYSSLFPLPN